MARKFKLSNIIPNSWFYKTKQHVPHSHSSASSSSAISQLSNSIPSQPLPRKSYHFTRQLSGTNEFYDSPQNDEFSDTHLAELPRKSSKQGGRRRTAARSYSMYAGSSCRTMLESVWTKSESPPEFSSSPFDSSPDGEFRTDAVLPTESFDCVVSWTASKSNSCVCKSKTTLNDDDVIIDVKKNSITTKANEVDDFNRLPELELAPIITKPATFTDMVRGIKKKETKNPISRKTSVKIEETNSREKIAVKEQSKSPSRKFSGNSPGVRLRMNSPRVGSRKTNTGSGRKSISSSSTSTNSGGSNKSLSDSLAIVKSSFDPQRDFRESMVEMIVENKIRASKDLEDLLACYLSLNADEYHDLIIKVFKQIWFDLPKSRSSFSE